MVRDMRGLSRQTGPEPNGRGTRMTRIDRGLTRIRQKTDRSCLICANPSSSCAPPRSLAVLSYFFNLSRAFPVYSSFNPVFTSFASSRFASSALPVC